MDECEDEHKTMYLTEFYIPSKKLSKDIKYMKLDEEAKARKFQPVGYNFGINVQRMTSSGESIM